MRKIQVRLVSLFSFLVLIGCSKMCGGGRESMSPEEVVQAYLDISLNMTDVAQKKELLKLTTGTLRSALEGATDEVLTSAFIKQNFKLERYSVVERRDRTPRETEITFTLSYRNLGPDKSIKLADAPQTTTENTVSVIKREGAWSIADVLGKKTSIDFILGDEIKPVAGGSDPGPEEPAPSNEP
ncbi:MAG: hypothetical protein NTX25_10065 [Proteobacteria bacterium]|nr:hypothetical protein [Pseudomonadota bacterium]